MGVCSISLKAGLVADAAPRPRQTGTNRIGPVKSQANMVEVVNSLAGMVVGTNAGVEGHRRGRNPPVQLHRALLFVLALAGFSGDSGGSVIPYNLDWSAEREGLRGDGLHEMSRNHGLRRTSSILIDGTCQGPAVAGSYRPFSTGALRDTALSAQRESCCHIRGGGDCLPFLRWEVTTENLNAQLLKAAAHGKTKKVLLLRLATVKFLSRHPATFLTSLTTLSLCSEQVVELIERGAAVNCMDASKQTPLLKAAGLTQSLLHPLLFPFSPALSLLLAPSSAVLLGEKLFCSVRALTVGCFRVQQSTGTATRWSCWSRAGR